MTRFKELRRIERAIKNRDPTELRWAAEYCRWRLSFSTTKQGDAYWRRIEKRVVAALDEIDRFPSDSALIQHEADRTITEHEATWLKESRQ
jgi:hypothetical protein